MKKIKYLAMLLVVACVLGSCAWGTYVPHSLNLLGNSTSVVLDKANYRVVRNVETVIEINNSHLRRADVEKSAFAELMRQYPLTGSQAYINVVVEEVRRENTNLFRFFFGGKPKVKQYVAVRAIIIEFLQENGEPIKSVESPYTTVNQSTAPIAKTKPSSEPSKDIDSSSEDFDETAGQVFTITNKLNAHDHLVVKNFANTNDEFIILVNCGNGGKWIKLGKTNLLNNGETYTSSNDLINIDGYSTNITKIKLISKNNKRYRIQVQTIHDDLFIKVYGLNASSGILAD